MHGHHITTAASWASTFLSPACLTQPSEPFLFPRLRVKYAEFPYLHYSIVRGSSPWRPDANMGMASLENKNDSLRFSRADKSVSDTTRGVMLYGGDIPICGQPDSSKVAFLIKKKTLLGTLANVSVFVHATALHDTQKSPARRQRRCTKTSECHLPP